MTVIVIDGYNVIHRDAELRRQLIGSLETARESLIRSCVTWLAQRRDAGQFYVVFDGDRPVDALQTGSRAGVKVFYTDAKQTADDWILALLRKRRHDQEYTIVSDDNYVRRTGRQLGAAVMSVADFLRTARGKAKSEVRTESHDAKRCLSPTEEREINESLKRTWGIE